MSLRQLHTVTIIHRPIDEVFTFFSQAENLNLITPPELHFQILTPLPVKMRAGTTIDYQIRLYGVPFHWKTLISVWEPPFRFIDEQIDGPYRRWIHEHRFEPIANQTRMTDTVQYVCPGGLFFEPLIHWLVVKKKVEYIFDYRQRTIQKLFAGPGDYINRTPQ